MAYTKAQYRAAALAEADATGSSRWDTTASTGEVDRKLGLVFDREWKNILNVNPYYRAQKLTPTTSSTGRIAISDLTSGSGNTIRRFYRILGIMRNNTVYDPAELRENLLAESLNAQSFTFQREGTDIFLLPKEVSVQFEVWVNWIPQRTDKLSADGDTIDFPEEYEELLRYAGAAALLLKGGTETAEAQWLKQEAKEIREEMLQDIGRLSIHPNFVKHPDLAIEWGGY